MIVPIQHFNIYDVLSTTKHTEDHISAKVDDGAVLVLMLARRHLPVALDGGILLAGLRFVGVIFRRGGGGCGRFRFGHIGFGRLVCQLDQGCVGVGSRLGGSVQEDTGRGIR